MERGGRRRRKGRNDVIILLKITKKILKNDRKTKMSLIP